MTLLIKRTNHGILSLIFGNEGAVKMVAKKLKRNQRLVVITKELLQSPNRLLNLQTFASQLGCAKSSISEDLDIIRHLFDEHDLGKIQTLTGKSGGVIYHPTLSQSEISHFQEEVSRRMQTGKRILAGNYIYVNDLLQDPQILRQCGQLIAGLYLDQEIDAVLTIEAKGIGLAVMVANFLNKPYVVVRREASAGEGSTISVNYLSGSHQNVRKMELSKASLSPNSRVLIVDDFLRNGGTMLGLLNLVEEFDSKTVGICVFAENKANDRLELPHYQALFETQLVYDEELRHYLLATKPGNLFKSIIDHSKSSS
ncbi:pur operon repressor [Facklamia languida]